VVHCGFKIDIRYRDEETGEYVPYKCPETENILDSGLCIFHDENYLKESKNKEVNEQNFNRKFLEKMAISESLICIGYYLPDVSFEKKQFVKIVNFSGAVFVGKANFLEAQFTEAYFHYTQFKNEADFTEAQFTKEAHFYKAQFTKEAHFSGAHFFKTGDFYGANFTETNFAGAQFAEAANFEAAQFAQANFERARFAQDANFSKSEFAQDANFFDARFTRADFLGARFIDNANFASSEFKEKANFYRVVFHKEALFSNVRFVQGADFLGVDFGEKAHFNEARFHKEALFYQVRFLRGEADFVAVEFREKANFTDAEFRKKSNYTRSIFTEEAVFLGADFQNEVNFNGVQFLDKANFVSAKFAVGVNFSLVHFTKEVLFSGAKFTNPILDFRSTWIDDQEHFVLPINDFSQVSFANTDISRIRFAADVVWGNGSKIRDEREIEDQLRVKNEAEGIKLGDILSVYRNLRDNYEFNMRYAEAGGFFIREMEINRLYTQTNRNGEERIKRRNVFFRNLSLTGLYYHLSRYGESFSRPALFGIGIVILSTLLWLTQPNPAADFSLQNITVPQIITVSEMDNKTSIELAFERGLTNFLPSLSFGTELNVGLLDVAFKIVGGAVTFGLIIIALRRKFERKFRH
jgi:uncharacterized protein YjbI with pentapeptide repeats